MSHSQFRCIILILRHAWLNLADKRMTTGRINQITILKQNSSTAPSKGLPREELSQVVRFAKNCMILKATTNSKASVSSSRPCAFMTCNQLGNIS